MAMLLVKYAVSALLIVGVSEIARNSERLGAFVGALPLVTIIIISWLYIETKDTQKVAEYSKYTFWYVLPTLPSMLIFAWMMNKEYSIAVAGALSIASNILFLWILSLVSTKFGVKLF